MLRPVACRLPDQVVASAAQHARGRAPTANILERLAPCMVRGTPTCWSRPSATCSITPSSGAPPGGNSDLRVGQGGKSAGSARHTHPLWMTYRIASTTTRRLCSSGRPPAAVWQAGTGSNGAISAHSASVVSEGYKRRRRQHGRAHAQAGVARQTGTRAPGVAGWFRHPCHYQEPCSHTSQSGSCHPKTTTCRVQKQPLSLPFNLCVCAVR